MPDEKKTHSISLAEARPRLDLTSPCVSKISDNKIDMQQNQKQSTHGKLFDQMRVISYHFIQGHKVPGVSWYKCKSMRASAIV
jgi:hypothetical protein